MSDVTRYCASRDLDGNHHQHDPVSDSDCYVLASDYDELRLRLKMEMECQEQSAAEIDTLTKQLAEAQAALKVAHETMLALETELCDRGYYCESEYDETPWQTVSTEMLCRWDAAKVALDKALATREARDE